MKTTPACLAVVFLASSAIVGCDDDPPSSSTSERSITPDRSGEVVDQPAPPRSTDTGSSSGGRVDSRVDPGPIDSRVDAGDLRQPNVDSERPLDQGDSAADRELDARLEQAIDRLSGLSESARAVRVTVINGRATLRGSVASEDERQRLLQLAGDVVGLDRVTLDLSIR